MKTDPQTSFMEFHAKNPDVYKALVRMAREYSALHPHQKIGIKTLWENLRWHYLINVHRTDQFKLNNNHAAYYSRLIMSANPDLEGLFEIRNSKGRRYDSL